MTVHPISPADHGGTDGGVPQSQTRLNRLRMRQEALRQQAAQLEARAEHLERVHAASAQRLNRRIDAHEKIVLGALVKKAGLDFTRPRSGRQNDNETASMPKRLDDLAADYDRELILGALLWLASALRETNEKALAVPSLQGLREGGQRALRRSGH